MSNIVKLCIIFTPMQTIAKEYIQRKLAEYAEPVKKGKARTAAVGMSRPKYTAALVMAIYDLSTAEAEDIINVRRGLISKWRTEPTFRQQMELFQDEFIEGLKIFLAKDAYEDDFDDGRHYSLSIKQKIVALGDDAVKRRDSKLLRKVWQILRISEFL